jgi:hypothetical protein
MNKNKLNMLSTKRFGQNTHTFTNNKVTNLDIDNFIKNNNDCIGWSKNNFNPRLSSKFHFYNYEFLDMANNITNINCKKTIISHMKLLILDIDMINGIVELLKSKKILYFNNGGIVQLLDEIIDNELECLDNVKFLFSMYLEKSYKC